MSQTSRPLRAIIGSRWLVYLPAFAWLTPLWLVSSTLSSRLDDDAWRTAAIAGINLLSILVVAGLFFLYRATIWNPQRASNRNGVHPLIVLAGGFSLGVVKAGVAVWLEALWVINDDANVLARIVSGGMLGAVTTASVSALFSQLEIYRLERQTLIADIIQREVDTTSREQSQSLPELHQFVRDSIAELNASSIGASALADTLDSIRERRVRPMSHQIWERENARIPDFRLATLVALSVSRLRFAIIPVAIIYFSISFPVFIPGLGLSAALATEGAQLAILLVILGLLRLLKVHSIVWGTVIFILISGALATLLTAGTAWMTGSRLPLPAGQVGVLLWLLIVTATLSTSVWRDVRETRDTVRAELTRADPMVGINDIAKSQAALANRALARLLHADVQNELLARSVALRALPNETGDSESLQRIIDEHRAAVVTYLTQLAEEQRSFPSNETLDDFMVGQAASWNGVATILFSGCDDLTLDSDVARALKDVGAEAIANAVKHGMATRVEVSLRAEPEGLVITVDDDGLGPRGGAHGLGAFLYTSVSHSAWRLTESPTLRGARLTLRVKREG